MYLIIRQYPGNSNEDSSPSLEENRKTIIRQNDLNLIDRKGEVITNQPPQGLTRDPYASEDFLVTAQGMCDSTHRLISRIFLSFAFWEEGKLVKLVEDTCVIDRE